MGHSNGRSRLLKAEDRKGNKIMGDAMEFSCSRRERGDRVKRSGGWGGGGGGGGEGLDPCPVGNQV